jgi:hypothetical protein
MDIEKKLSLLSRDSILHMDPLISTTFGIAAKQITESNVLLITPQKVIFSAKENNDGIISEGIIEQNISTTLEIKPNSTDFKKYDYIIGGMPMGLRKSSWVSGEYKLNSRENWVNIFKSLLRLNEDGMGFFYVEPSLIQSNEGDRFTEYLEKNGFYINALFRAPEKLIYTHSSLRPMIILITKEKNEKLFVGDMLNYENHLNLLKNFKDGTPGDRLSDGFLFERGNFEGFESYYINKNLEKLLKQYGDFEKVKLKDLIVDISLGKAFENLDNTVIIPKIGKSDTKINYEKRDLKDQNYFFIRVNDRVLPKYLSKFFNTHIGILLRQALHTGNIIPSINKSKIENLVIPLPSVEIQKNLASLNDKFDRLKEKINKFEKESVLNPINTGEIVSEVDKLLNSLNSLTESEEIISLIRESENKNVEFKESFGRKAGSKRDKESILRASIKNIAGFVNSEGGTLLVGVKDDGGIAGLESDGFESDDKLLLFIADVLDKNFGAKIHELVSYQIVDIDGLKVARFDCKRGHEEIYVAGEEDGVFVRSSPRTRKLMGKEMIEYLKSHFKK